MGKTAASDCVIEAIFSGESFDSCALLNREAAKQAQLKPQDQRHWHPVFTGEVVRQVPTIRSGVWAFQRETVREKP